MSVPSPSRTQVGPTSSGVLTDRSERFIRLTAVWVAVLIAACAMVLSYAGLHDLALDAQIPEPLALLVPVMVDGLQFVGSLGVVYSTLSGLRTWYPWMLLMMGVSVSAWGNWQAAPPDLTAKLLHAAAPIILALVLEELLRVMRHKVRLATAAAATPVPAPVPAATSEETGTVGVVAGTGEATEEALPEGLSADVPSPDLDAPTTREVSADGPTDGPPATSAPSVEEAAAASPRHAEQSSENGSWDMRPVVLPPSAVRERRPDSAPSAPSTPSTPKARDKKPAPAAPDGVRSFRDEVAALLTRNPDATAASIARDLGKDPSYTRKVVRDVKAELEAAPAPGLSDDSAAASTGTSETATAAPALAPADQPTPSPTPTASPTASPTAAAGETTAPVASDDPFWTPPPVTVTPTTTPTTTPTATPAGGTGPVDRVPANPARPSLVAVETTDDLPDADDPFAAPAAYAGRA